MNGVNCPYKKKEAERCPIPPLRRGGGGAGKLPSQDGIGSLLLGPCLMGRIDRIGLGCSSFIAFKLGSMRKRLSRSFSDYSRNKNDTFSLELPLAPALRLLPRLPRVLVSRRTHGCHQARVHAQMCVSLPDGGCRALTRRDIELDLTDLVVGPYNI